jgi:hypothetical protein
MITPIDRSRPLELEAWRARRRVFHEAVPGSYHLQRTRLEPIAERKRWRTRRFTVIRPRNRASRI